MPAGGGDEGLVHERLSRGNRTNWTVADGRIYHLASDVAGLHVLCHDCAGHETREALRVQGLGGPGLDVAPGGAALLYARTDDAAPI